MSPTLKQGEVIIARSFGGNPNALHRFDIVVFRSPTDPSTTWTMRLVGLPGERIEVKADGLVINGSELDPNELPEVLRSKAWLSTPQLRLRSTHEWVLGTNDVFVIGDNLGVANDSRYWGPLNLSSIVGVFERKTGGRQVQIGLP